MKKLWDIQPLKDRENDFLYPEKEPSILIDGVTFAPSLCSILKFSCQLDITILWPEEPGIISQHGGDIDED